MILLKAYEIVSNTLGTPTRNFIVWAVNYATDGGWKPYVDRIPNVVGVIVASLLVIMLAYILASYVGKQVWGLAEHRLRRVPLVGAVYPSVKQVIDFLFDEHALSFQSVVVFEYPRKGLYTLGFVTSKAFREVEAVAGRDMATVFVPSSPTPFTGYCVQVPADELVKLDVTVDAALKYVISGGVIMPASQGPAASAQGAVFIEGREDSGEAEVK